MDTDAIFREIEGIDIERKRLLKEMRKLNARRQDYKNKLVDAAQERCIETLEYKGKKYQVKQKVTHTRKGDNARRKDGIRTLSNYVDEDEVETVYDELSSALKGKQTIKFVINV
jgi:hypothetical protein